MNYGPKLKTLVVAGTFDELGGKPSKLINKLFENYPKVTTFVNGGYYSELKEICSQESIDTYNIVFWMANVDNSLPKIRNIKELNQKCILITSKRNDTDRYCFEELISRSLELKANLTFEFSMNHDGLFTIMVFDPLGVAWCPRTTDYKVAMEKAYKRIIELVYFTRQSAILCNDRVDFEVEKEFIDIIHEKADIFHRLIQPPEVVNRFLGNASFRCTHGFPSFRDGNYIVMSRRNVNKQGITSKDFVAMKLTDFGPDGLMAYGGNKPSVDAPIQIRLYFLYPNIMYMLHSHVYIKGAVFTEKPVPCGALEEVSYINDAVSKNNIDTNKSFCINLIGHGSIVFATSLDYFSTIEYIKRNIPEVLE